MGRWPRGNPGELTDRVPWGGKRTCGGSGGLCEAPDWVVNSLEWKGATGLAGPDRTVLECPRGSEASLTGWMETRRKIRAGVRAGLWVVVVGASVGMALASSRVTRQDAAGGGAGAAAPASGAAK